MFSRINVRAADGCQSLRLTTLPSLATHEGVERFNTRGGNLDMAGVEPFNTPEIHRVDRSVEPFNTPLGHHPTPAIKRFTATAEPRARACGQSVCGRTGRKQISRRDSSENTLYECCDVGTRHERSRVLNRSTPIVFTDLTSLSLNADPAECPSGPGTKRVSSWARFDSSWCRSAGVLNGSTPPPGRTLNLVARRLQKRSWRAQ